MDTNDIPLSRTIETRTEFITLEVAYYVSTQEAPGESQAIYKAVEQAGKDYPEAIKVNGIKVIGAEEISTEMRLVHFRIEFIRHLQK